MEVVANLGMLDGAVRACALTDTDLEAARGSFSRPDVGRRNCRDALGTGYSRLC